MSQPRPRLRRALRTATTVAFVSALTAGVALALRGQDWRTLADLLRAGAIPALLAAMLVAVAGLLCGARAWMLALSATGSPVPTGACVRMFFVGFLGKFVPGRLWGLLAQIRLGERAGVGGARVAGTYLVNLVVVLLTGAMVGLLVAPVLFDAGLAWLSISAVFLAVLAAWPRLIDRLVGLAARLTRRPCPAPLTRPGDIRRSIAYQTASWVLSGLHVWIIAVLLGADPVRALPVAVGGFTLASVAGALALFVPDGAGVRELLLVAGLATVLPWPAAVTTAVASRVLTTLAELLTAGVALLAAGLWERRAIRRDAVLISNPT
nr:lysylphosphatidylglycerol synthase domain-containing protein [Micromonospora sp. DSM 115978]